MPLRDRASKPPSLGELASWHRGDLKEFSKLLIGRAKRRTRISRAHLDTLKVAEVVPHLGLPILGQIGVPLLGKYKLSRARWAQVRLSWARFGGAQPEENQS